MKKVKAILVLFVLIAAILILSKGVNAHSVELDPKSLISMPTMIIGGSGTIKIADSVSDYTLYFQGVEIPSTVNSQREKVVSDGKKDLEALKEAYKALKTQADNLKTTLDEASKEYQEGIKNNLSETELEALKTAYETALNNYKAKTTEYSDKVKEYNNKVDEINYKIKELTPTYVESNWTKTTDNKISIDVTKFFGEQPYVIWVKLVTSTGVYYDEEIYTMQGTKEDIDVESVNLDKTSLSINKGSNYTLTATITPSNATNKSLTWKSDNEKVATVSNGKVTGVSEGTVTITVITEDGNYSATCKVTVTEVTNKDEAQDKPGTSGTEDTNSENSNNGGTSDNGTTTDLKDPTTAKGELPQTGLSYTIAIIIIAVIGVSVFTLKKCRNLRDI